MLCQNCGRRASDSVSFCPSCGAVASSDVPRTSVMTGPPSTPATAIAPLQSARSSPQRRANYKVAYQRPAARGGSSLGSTVVFLGVMFGMAYWLTKTDDFDLITYLKDRIESNVNGNRSAPPPMQMRQPERLTMPQTTTPAERTGSRPAAAPPVSPRGTPSDIEGLTSAQVEQRLGAPTRRVSGGDGVNVWVYQYQNAGTLIVYFYKDRASLKAPR